MAKKTSEPDAGDGDDEPAMSFEERRSRMRDFAERAKDVLRELA